MSAPAPAGETTEEFHAAAELSDATRRLMLAVATTAVGTADMRAAVGALDRLGEQLSTRTRGRALRAPFDGPSRTRDQGADASWRVFATNPQVLPLDIHFDGDGATARTTADALYEGPPGIVHGGFLAHLLDTLLGTLVQAKGLRGHTASLELRYRAPTPLDQPLDLHARIVETRGRRTIAEGWIEHDGQRTVEATGTFVDVTRETA